MYRGDSFVFDLTVYKADGCTRQDILGWKVWFTAKEHYAAPDGAPGSIQLGTSPLTGVTITSPSAGQIEVVIPASATVAFPDTPTRMIYDVQVKDGAGRVFTIERGTLTVLPDVTRAV